MTLMIGLDHERQRSGNENRFTDIPALNETVSRGFCWCFAKLS